MICEGVTATAAELPFQLQHKQHSTLLNQFETLHSTPTAYAPLCISQPNIHVGCDTAPTPNQTAYSAPRLTAHRRSRECIPKCASNAHPQIENHIDHLRTASAFGLDKISHVLHVPRHMFVSELLVGPLRLLERLATDQNLFPFARWVDDELDTVRLLRFVQNGPLHSADVLRS